MRKKFKVYVWWFVVIAYIGLLRIMLSINGPKAIPTERQDQFLSIGSIASCLIVTIILGFWVNRDKEK